MLIFFGPLISQEKDGKEATHYYPSDRSLPGESHRRVASFQDSKSMVEETSLNLICHHPAAENVL